MSVVGTLSRDKLPVIAIDGGAYTGTTSLAKNLASGLGGSMVNTGSMFRAYAWAVLFRHGVAALADHDLCTEVARDVVLNLHNGTVQTLEFRSRTGLINVSKQLYAPDVEAAVSPVSVHAGVRDEITTALRKILPTVSSESRPYVVEGRDIGTVVCPEAKVKFWLTASDEARVERALNSGRPKDGLSNPVIDDLAAQLARRDYLDAHRGDPVDRELYEAMERIEETRRKILDRDARDASRAVAPMVPARDAVHLDTTNLTQHEVLVMATALCRARLSA